MSALVLAVLLATIGAMSGVASAEGSGEVVQHPELTVSVAMRAHGPWGATYISADVVETADGPVWAFCTQAPIPGGAEQGTEADLAEMADANSDAVRVNEHRIRWVLTHNSLPDPRNVLRLQPRIGIFDWQGGEVAREDVTAEQPLVHQYAQGPEQGHSYYDSLPLPRDLRIEIAAVQVAVWHYSDGFDPDAGSRISDQGLYSKWGLRWEAGDVTPADVLARYRELVAAADAAEAPAEPSVSITELENTGQPDIALFEVSGEGLDEVSVAADGGSLHPYDTGSSTCDSATTVDTVDPSQGPVVLCTMVTSDGEIVVRAEGTTSGEALVYIDRGSAQDLVTRGVRQDQAVAVESFALTHVVPTTTSTTTTSTTTTSTTTTSTTTTTTAPTTVPEQPSASVQRATITRTPTGSGSTGTRLAFTGSSSTPELALVAALMLLGGLGALLGASSPGSR